MNGLTGITLHLDIGSEKWLFYLVIQMNQAMVRKWKRKILRAQGIPAGEHPLVAGL